MTEKEKIDQIHEQQSALYQFYFEENRYERPIWCSNCRQQGHKANACRKPKVIKNFNILFVLKNMYM